MLFWLSLIVFLPAVVAIALAFFPKSDQSDDSIRFITFGTTVVVLVACVVVFMVPGGWGEDFKYDQADEAAHYMQSVFSVPWIPSFDIYYYMGIDGISFPLLMLTAFVSMLAMGASWSIKKHVKAYCILFLLLETGMLGVFLALDFFLFYVFWEVMLLPMYFLIGVWGGPRREYAAIKFFLYTLLGSVLMLVAILMLYFSSDLTRLTDQQQAETRVLDTVVDENGIPILGGYWRPLKSDATPDQVATREDLIRIAAEQLDQEIADGKRSRHTFNLLALAAIGQSEIGFDVVNDDGEVTFSTETIQWWAFLLLFIGFAIKVPAVPVHTWLPDAHVEAPTPISMILAGILLKMGGYGIIRICYPICPFGGYELRWFVCTLGVISMLYGAFAALAQKDFKRMVAYSSVSHMGYVVLGLGVWSATAPMYNPDYWNMGVQGAMFQMIGHGISSAGMFFMVGVIYDRVHHRNLNEFGGLYGKMPVYTALSIGIFFAALGLPGLCGFIGEVFVVLSVWPFSILLAVLSASVVVLTAAYILWALQRVYLGFEYRGPHEDQLTPSNLRENLIGGTLLVMAIVFGVFPYQTVLKYMNPTIEKQVRDLADWTERTGIDRPPETEDVAATPSNTRSPESGQQRLSQVAADDQP